MENKEMEGLVRKILGQKKPKANKISRRGRRKWERALESYMTRRNFSRASAIGHALNIIKIVEKNIRDNDYRLALVGKDENGEFTKVIGKIDSFDVKENLKVKD